MNTIVVPLEGRPTSPTTSEDLVGVDGNAWVIMGATTNLLRRAGASKSFLDAYHAEATSGDYDHLVATSVAYLELELLDPDDAVEAVEVLREAER